MAAARKRTGGLVQRRVRPEREVRRSATQARSTATATRRNPPVRAPAVQGEGARRPALPLAEVPAHRSGVSAVRVVRADRGVVRAQPPPARAGRRLWVGRRISRGVKDVAGDNIEFTGQTWSRLRAAAVFPARKTVQGRHQGRDAVAPPHAAGLLTPRAKTHNYLNLIVADQEVRASIRKPGRCCSTSTAASAKGLGSNIFIVRGEEILTPRKNSCCRA